MKVRLTSRRSKDARCAFCHGDLDGVVFSCPRCMATFHGDCRSHLAQCPTLGCGTVFTQVPDVTLDTEQPGSPFGEIVGQSVPALFVVLLLLGGAALCMTPQAAPYALALAAAGLALLAREAWFLIGAKSLLGREPIPMHVEVRIEERNEDRLHFVRLIAPDGRLIDIEEGFISFPDWLLTLRPGAIVHVFDAGSGPVAIVAHDGSYSVPGRRVHRH
jgi:hypothetical protein